MKTWLKGKSILTICTCALLAGLATTWISYGLFGHRLIEAMYKQESIEILNRVMDEGRAVTPLEDYYEAADRIMVTATINILTLFLILTVLIAKPLGVVLACYSFLLCSLVLFSLFELFPNLIKLFRLDDHIDYYNCKANLVADSALVHREKPFISYTYFDYKGSLYSPLYGVDVPGLTFERTNNELGFRTNSTARFSDIVVMGDSFVGIGLNDDETFGRRLEKISSLTVTSLGEGGYGPFQYLELLKRYGVGKKPKYAIFSFFEGNDIADLENYRVWRNGGEYDGITFCFRKPFFKRYISALERTRRYARSAVRSTVQLALNKALNKSDANGGAPHPDLVALNIGGETHKGLFFFYQNDTRSTDEILSSDAWQDLKEILKQFKNISLENNITPIIMYIPIDAHIYADYSTEQSGKKWLKIRNQQIAAKKNRVNAMVRLSQGLDLELIDLSPIFESAARDGKLLYYPFDNHWNSEGRQVAAEFVAQVLKRKQIVSAQVIKR